MTSAEDRLQFFKQLQLLTNKIHAANDIDDIMLDMSAELCELFSGDRLTIYSLSDDKASMVSKVKTGLASFKQLKLPISAQSIAGYAALSRRMLNLLDVYDEAELRRHDMDLCFQQGVDRRTGYRTKEMLVSPILDDKGEVLGVLQLINNRNGGPFDAMVEEGVQHICGSLAIAFLHSHKAPTRERGRFAAMLSETVLPRVQLDLAMRNAAARNVDIEDVLLDELAIKPGVVGRALADFFGVPYFMFQVDRRRPHGLLDSFNREYVVQNQWMPIEEGRNGLYVLAVDPDQLKASGAVQRVFPGSKPVYCVTTRREFGWMVNQFFGAAQPDTAHTDTIPPTAASRPAPAPRAAGQAAGMAAAPAAGSTMPPPAGSTLPPAAATRPPEVAAAQPARPAPGSPFDAAAGAAPGQHVGQYIGHAADNPDATIVRPLGPVPPPPMPALPDVEQTLIANTIGQIATSAAQQGIRELHIETTPGENGDIHFKVTGVIRLVKN
ncbi:GAF domain-containing protein [Pseudoduganella namucuonensis]|uniref:GAF domain-containing protein n=1 Tax=Pseudoduganella namucuonensis TaxID=1035707 RepID=A0A1I7L591_9BURK|nr:GAF domain-containing protein [Pseudoduganella namucuonensis]SFV04805.1 GAF domain-containing protein [Pseudoduganella namucuonensis]